MNKTKNPYYAYYKNDKEKNLYRVFDVTKDFVSLSLKDYHDTEQDYYTPKKEVVFLTKNKKLLK